MLSCIEELSISSNALSDRQSACLDVADIHHLAESRFTSTHEVAITFIEKDCVVSHGVQNDERSLTSDRNVTTSIEMIVNVTRHLSWNESYLRHG